MVIGPTLQRTHLMNLVRHPLNALSGIRVFSLPAGKISPMIFYLWSPAYKP